MCEKSDEIFQVNQNLNGEFHFTNRKMSISADDPYLLDQCIKITKEFIDNKLAMYFIEPFNPGPDKYAQAEYNSKIKKPMDLSTILKKLSRNAYLSIQDWADDVFLVFDNAVKFNDANSLVGGVAIYLKRQFEKKLKGIEALNVRNFENQLIKLNQLLNETLMNPPPSLSVDCKHQTDTGSLDNFTVARLDNLLKNLEKFASEAGNQEKILACLNSLTQEPKYDTSHEIDVAKLGRNELLALEKLINGHE
ncbi:Bromodomain containing protein [Tritrichomonas foetus]|uniref:Bromodomain containing protein n=1 Tax=Tritrichomonas foetus TaxID=1144522 RepID=A0A1J4KI32_9EUKA|nr:Bromodomain containing protein [Tritrichomonas foetus]|eukprot:OHT10706.1 Bromodomain containing protein [Tritrichomonas foetus]